MSVSRKFQRSEKQVRRGFRKGLKEVLCGLTEISTVLQESFTGISRKFYVFLVKGFSVFNGLFQRGNRDLMFHGTH